MENSPITEYFVIKHHNEDMFVRGNMLNDTVSSESGAAKFPTLEDAKSSLAEIVERNLAFNDEIRATPKHKRTRYMSHTKFVIMKVTINRSIVG